MSVAPLQFLLLLFAGWVNRRQLEIVEFLQETRSAPADIWHRTIAPQPRRARVYPFSRATPYTLLFGIALSGALEPSPRVASTTISGPSAIVARRVAGPCSRQLPVHEPERLAVEDRAATGPELIAS